MDMDRETFPIETITFISWLSKAHGHFIMQNAFSLSPRVPNILVVPTLFKSPSSKSLLRLKPNSML
jgi:hypothetical protein